MVSLCKYRHIFGREGEGAHKYRVFNIAVVDALLTILLAWAISYFFHIRFWMVLFALLVLSVVIHRIFCVETTLTKFFTGWWLR